MKQNSTTRILKAQELGQKMAVELFVTFLNPKARGPKFQWSDLPKIVVDLTRTHADGISLRVPKDPALRNELIAAACEAAELEVQRLLKKSGVETWLKLPQGD